MSHSPIERIIFVENFDYLNFYSHQGELFDIHPAALAALASEGRVLAIPAVLPPVPPGLPPVTPAAPATGYSVFYLNTLKGNTSPAFE